MTGGKVSQVQGQKKGYWLLSFRFSLPLILPSTFLKLPTFLIGVELK